MKLKIIANGLFTMITKRFAGGFWFRKLSMRRSQYFTKERMEALQLKLLKKVVANAYRHVPYYSEYMQSHGFTPKDIKTLDDIKRFPVLTKQDVIAIGTRMYSAKYPRFMVRIATTGGTTGVPTRLARDVFSISNEHAFIRRQWELAGIGLWEKCAFFTAREIHTPGDYNGRYYYFDPIMRELVLSTYHLSEESAVDYAALMKKYNVKAINGYPSAISFLAKVCIARGIDLKLKAVLTTSETLTADMREVIRRAFDCNVYDYFGSAERVCYIQTCECGSYHLLPEYGYTEFLPLEGSKTGECRVISTGFWNKAMPLIRYDMGDIVVPDDKICGCKRNYPCIKSISGRSNDVIKTPSGILFTITNIIHMFYVIGQNVRILEIQIIQDTIDHAAIEFVPGDPAGKAQLDLIMGIVRRYIPEELKIDIRTVEKISRTKSGKLRPIVSLIK